MLKKTLISFALGIVFLLVFSSRGFGKEIELRLTYFESRNQKAQIEIETSKPVHYHCFYTHTPPGLVVDFFENEIYSHFDKKIVLGDGPIEKIETFCFNKKGEVDSLFFKFRHTPKIIATPKARSLTIKINNFLLKPPGGSLEKQTEVALALSLAKEKLQQAKPVQGPVVDFQRDANAGDGTSLVSEKEASSVPAALTLLKTEKQILFHGGETLSQGKKKDIVVYDKFGKAIFRLPFPDWEILDGFALAVRPKPASRKVTHKNINEPQFLSSLVPVTSPAPYGFLVIFTYLFGSLFLVSVVALGYKTESKRKNEKLFFVDEKDQEQIIFKATESEKKTKASIERRRLPRLEVDNLGFKGRPRLSAETIDNPRPDYSCRLRNLSLGGVRFELGPRVHVPLIAQMKISLPKKQAIEVCAKIVWYRSVQAKRKTYGACFLTINEADRKILDSYLARNLHPEKRNANLA